MTLTDRACEKVEDRQLIHITRMLRPARSAARQHAGTIVCNTVNRAYTSLCNSPYSEKGCHESRRDVIRVLVRRGGIGGMVAHRQVRPRAHRHALHPCDGVRVHASRPRDPCSHLVPIRMCLTLQADRLLLQLRPQRHGAVVASGNPLRVCHIPARRPSHSFAGACESDTTAHACVLAPGAGEDKVGS